MRNRTRLLGIINLVCSAVDAVLSIVFGLQGETYLSVMYFIFSLLTLLLAFYQISKGEENDPRDFS